MIKLQDLDKMPGRVQVLNKCYMNWNNQTSSFNMTVTPDRKICSIK